MSISKQEISELVKRLPDKDLPLVADLLKRLINNPLDANIPYDDEPLSEEDIEDIKKAEKEIAEGNFFKLVDIKDELLRN